MLRTLLNGIVSAALLFSVTGLSGHVTSTHSAHSIPAATTVYAAEILPSSSAAVVANGTAVSPSLQSDEELQDAIDELIDALEELIDALEELQDELD
jgi:hypothetical protein